MTRRCLTADIIDMGHLARFSPSLPFSAGLKFPPPAVGVCRPWLCTRNPAGPGLPGSRRHASGAGMASSGQISPTVSGFFSLALAAIQFKLNSRRAKYTKVERQKRISYRRPTKKNWEKSAAQILVVVPSLKAHFVLPANYESEVVGW